MDQRQICCFCLSQVLLHQYVSAVLHVLCLTHSDAAGFICQRPIHPIVHAPPSVYLCGFSHSGLCGHCLIDLFVLGIIFYPYGEPPARF